jgi:hypothetical protein
MAKLKVQVTTCVSLPAQTEPAAGVSTVIEGAADADAAAGSAKAKVSKSSATAENWRAREGPAGENERVSAECIWYLLANAARATTSVSVGAGAMTATRPGASVSPDAFVTLVASMPGII